MMQDIIQIRSARPDDAERAAILLYSAYMHTPITSSAPEEQENGFIKRLQRFFGRDDNRFSYQNIQVAELHSEVVGLVLSFGGRDEARLNNSVGGWLEREAEDDEWYVDALAVFEQWNHKGIGTRLLQEAEQQTCLHHYAKIALNVAQDNTRAIDLYTHLHYVRTQQTFLYQHPYIRMVKILECLK